MLQFLLIDERAYKSGTLSFLKARSQEPSYSIFLFNIIWESFLRSQSFFQILLRSDGFSFWIDELQGKISNNPKESWKVFSKIFRVILILVIMSAELNIFGEIDDQTKILNGILIDWTDWIIDKDGRTENGKGKYFNIVILIFV